ncbi:hypothetical protein [Tahibacter amnicola]|uniref:Uncharacterized protein n=1 Tax=Tahibacter amnicola TaxID=2976241 RepID=A0ABY6BBP6_9GAMM|nr:hypothetical protein [Tahibacter amnicola]UXI67119.1 hypothetical protein N4264_20590 [Tahibacter amnicola]
MDLQVAFLTGQSDPACCALSPSQSAFLDALPVPEHARVRRNFPYFEHGGEYRPVGLARAALNNLMQYRRARTADFAIRYRNTAVALLERARCTVLLAGSCGLELLNGLRLPPVLLRRVRVFAYGPVARQLPSCEVCLVQGDSDRLSRWYFANAHHIVACHHMNYLEQESVLNLCRQQLARWRGGFALADPLRVEVLS